MGTSLSDSNIGPSEAGVFTPKLLEMDITHRHHIQYHVCTDTTQPFFKNVHEFPPTHYGTRPKDI